MADDVTITVHVRDLTGPGFNSVQRNLNQLQRQAQQMGGSLRIVGGQLDGVARSASNAGQSLGGGVGLKGKLIGVAGVLGTTLLPSLGALAPMLTGVAVVGGGAALALDDLKKKAKELKPAFEDWKKVAEKAVAPHTEKAVKSLKGAMKDLTPVIQTGADTFGRITEKAAKFADSPAFKGALAKNAEMGAKWVEDFAGSVGTFTQAFLDFGTKSQPALDAWDNLLGGFLDTGLPSMFKELERGISGSSSWINGLAIALNDNILPALGKIAGSFSDAFGPLMGQMVRTVSEEIGVFADGFSGLMTVLKPVANTIADIMGALTRIGAIAASVGFDTIKESAKALMQTISDITGSNPFGDLEKGWRGFGDWVTANQATIRMAFTMVGISIMQLAKTGIEWAAILTDGFATAATGLLDTVSMIVTGIAAAMAITPGGEKWVKWAADFGKSTKGWKDDLKGLADGVRDFADAASPNLTRAQISLRVDQAEANLASIKRQLKDPELTKERRATLTASKEQAEEQLRSARASLKAFDDKKAEATLSADPRQFFGAAAAVNRTRFPGKSVRVSADLSSFRSAVGGVAGRVLGTSYINVQYRQSENNLQRPFSNANGSIMRFYANGGMENHVAQIAPAGSWRVWGEPETGGEAYIPLAPQKRSRSRAIAEETVGILGGQVEWFAKGGLTSTQLRGLSAPSDLSSLKQTLADVRTRIKDTTSGRTESRLLNVLDSVGKKLIAHEKALTGVNASLATAKDKLNDLKSASAQMATSIKSGVLSAANITRGVSGNGPTTVRSIMSSLTASRDKASAFAGALAGLRSKGLAASLLQQIAEAGIEGGGLETAGALLSASSSEIGSINSLQSQINASATAAGRTTADHMYTTAIKNQTVAVNKLQASQDKLERTMAALAKSLDKALRKATGGIVGAAATGGIRGSLTWVGEQGPELLDLPAGSRVWSNPDSRRKLAEARTPWASMLNAPRRPAAGPAPAVAGDGQPIVIQVRIGERDFGELWVDTGRKQVRSIGSIEATLKPTRGR
ncbi:hypothetical protein [Streptomyces sp. NPDC052015]|uniref:hypothetical protein n=1 Tax=Streptomyces sp. NPDC052015 TaxID=3154755 RepID=UPI0034441E5C